MPDLTFLRLLPGLLTGTQMWKGPFPLGGASFGLTCHVGCSEWQGLLGSLQHQGQPCALGTVPATPWQGVSQCYALSFLH